MQKECIDCLEIKPITEFHKSATCKGGREIRCKDCRAIKYPQGYQTAEYRRLHRYGLDASSYQELLDLQGGRCATCGIIPNRFYVDHDHACCPGVKSCGSCVRGLLCFNCNTALGQVRDNPKVLLAMIEYLEGDVL